MSGTGYAILEIVVFLVLATLIGFAIGWLAKRPRAAAPAAGGDNRQVSQLEARNLILEGRLTDVSEQLENAMARSEELRQEVEVLRAAKRAEPPAPSG